MYTNKKGGIKYDFSLVKDEKNLKHLKEILPYADSIKNNCGITPVNEQNPERRDFRVNTGREKQINPEKIPFPLIGTDESGKGDYFGPLVAAGMYTDKKIAVVLRQAKVRDSKLMTDEEIKKTAEIIRDNFPGCYSIIEISPMKYNKLYSEFRKENKNLNHLLAWAHAKAIEEILSKKECQTAISDKFGDEKYILSKLQEKGRKISLIQVTKAERNIAVAAASVLARDRFLGKLDELSESAGFRLPKGASKKVITAGRKIVDKEGKEALKRYAKIHFKTTGDITGIKP